jgi:hypothetical protein
MTRMRLLLATLLLVAVGCSGGGVVESSDELTFGEGGRRLPDRSSRGRLRGGDNGLELIQWVVEVDEAVLASTMAAHRDGPAVSPAIDEWLRRNGFRLVRVRVDDLDEMAAALGDLSFNQRIWHGQVLDWTPLVERSVDAGGEAIAVGGRVGRFEDGRFSLQVRAWTMQDVAGPVVYLELLPQFVSRREGGLRRLLQPDVMPGLALFDGVVDIQLEDGWAYVLTCAAPGDPWLDLSPDTGADAESPPPPAAPRGPGVGPDIELPPTVGQALLTARDQDARGLIVLVPRIPAAAYPPGAEPPPAADEEPVA